MFFYGVFTKVGSAIPGWINGNYEPKTPVIPRVYHKYLKASDKENLYPTATEAVELGTLTVASVAGSAQGTTAITVTETKGSGNIYKYKLGSAPESVTVEQDLTSWATWNGTDDIVVTAETVITVAECTSANLAVKDGSVAITVNAASSASRPDDEDPMAE